MVKKVLIFLILLMFGISFPLLALEDSIIAVVNDDIITLRDLQDYLNSVYSQLRIEGRSHNEIQVIMQSMESDGINRLIEDRLLITEANEQKLEVRPDIINERLAEIKSRYDSEQSFLDSLLADGNTITDLRNKIQEQLKVKFLVESEVKSKIFINPQEVTDYYKNHFEEFQKKERVDLQSIFVSSTSAPDQAEAKIKAVYSLLKNQGHVENVFIEIAQEYSEAPSIGMIERGQMLPVIEEAVFKLEVGDISDIIQVESGYYIFRLTKKYPMEMANLEEVKDLIYDKLYNMKFQNRFRSWLEKIKQKAYIEIKE